MSGGRAVGGGLAVQPNVLNLRKVRLLPETETEI